MPFEGTMYFVVSEITGLSLENAISSWVTTLKGAVRLWDLRSVL